jgi:hypothetical protein
VEGRQDPLGELLFQARKGRRPLNFSLLAMNEEFATADGQPPDPDLIKNAVKQALSYLTRDDGVRARLILGLDEASSRLKIQERYDALARLDSIDAATWRTDREGPFLDRAAAALRASWADMQQRLVRDEVVSGPMESKLGIDWLARSQFYSRYEATLIAIAVDLQLARRARDGEQLRTSYDDYLGTSLYWLVRGSALEVIRHWRFGGWILTRPDDEVQAHLASFAITFKLPPFSQRELSWLRRQLFACPQWEVDDFLERLDNDRGQALSAKWRTWAEACVCRGDVLFGNAACQVHQLFDQAETFSRAIRSHWNDLTDWYLATSESPTSADAPLYASTRDPQ